MWFASSAIVLVLLDLLRRKGQGAHLVLVFAWNPLLAIEVAGSGHVDIVGALLLVVSAAALVRRWRATAAIGLGLAIAVKFLPIVLLPLYWRRVRIRDAALAAAIVALLYVPFLIMAAFRPARLARMCRLSALTVPCLRHSPWWCLRSCWLGSQSLVGLVTAAWLRSAAPEWSSDQFAWPMAACLLFAPVVFPWYLLWLLPFLTSASTLLIILWSVSVIPTYVMWHFRTLGRPWGALPGWVMLLEYGCLATVRCHNCITPAHAARNCLNTRANSFNQLIAPRRDFCIRKSRGLIQDNILQLTEEPTVCEMPAFV